MYKVDRYIILGKNQFFMVNSMLFHNASRWVICKWSNAGYTWDNYHGKYWIMVDLDSPKKFREYPKYITRFLYLLIWNQDRWDWTFVRDNIIAVNQKFAQKNQVETYLSQDLILRKSKCSSSLFRLCQFAAQCLGNSNSKKLKMNKYPPLAQ